MTKLDSQSIDITYLADTRHFLPLLTDWFVAEWEPYYGLHGPGDARNDLLKCCQKDQLPIGLVATDNEETLLGTIALKADSVGSETGAGPWLAAFMVDPDRRKQGIGSRLIEALENEAQRQGFTEVFTSTDSAQHLLERRNWAVWSQTISLRGPIPIYRKSL